ncbi:hypothetical protein NDA11_003705 [Ustilago hordei]|nr:hypothetical protein NDA11_003705 [Ustilago hordei]UTT88686.1 hypothetical protein NDA17_001666 [Ustilago hordei]
MMVVKRKKNNFWRRYKKDELVFRLSLYLVTTPSAGAFGGLLANGILKIPHIGEVKSWEMNFLIEGLITIIVAIIGYFTLTDLIHTSRWLTDAEKAFLQVCLKSKLVVPPNVAGAIATLAFAYCSAKFKIRSVFTISGAITMCIGYAMFLGSKNLYVCYAASFFATSGAFTQGALLPAYAAVNANKDSERTGAIAVTVSPCSMAMLASICRRVSEA